MAARPSVRNVRIVGDAVEGITIKGVGDYLGGWDGPSKFVWLRKNMDTGSVFSSLICASTSLKVNCCTHFDALGIVNTLFLPKFSLFSCPLIFFLN